MEVFNFLVDVATAARMLTPSRWGGVGEVNVAILAVELGHFQKTRENIMTEVKNNQEGAGGGVVQTPLA